MTVELFSADGPRPAEANPVVLEGRDIRIELPSELTLEAIAEIRRLIELTEMLARRCSQLQEALESRVVIEQAKGVLVERLAIDPDEAFRLLRRSARSSRLRLRDVAATIVSSRVNPPELAAVVADGDAA